VIPGGRGLFRASLFTVARWKWLILAITLISTLAGAVYLVLQPRTRLAVARILLTGNPVHTAQATRVEASRLTSREVLRPVAQILLGEDTSRGEVDAVIEALFRDLRARTLAQPIGETNIIQLSHSVAPPDDPAHILRLIIDRYLEVYAKTNSPSQALLTFATQEHAKVIRDLEDSEERLDRWRKANGIVSVDAATTNQLEVLARGEAALHDTQAEAAAVMSKIDVLKQQLSAHPKHVTLHREHVTNPSIATLRAELANAEAAVAADRNSALLTKLRGDLVAAELALHELRQRYMDKDRVVQERLEQVALLKRELASAQEEADVTARSKVARLKEELATAEGQAEILGRQTVGLNPVREQLDRELASAEALLASLGSRQAALKAQARDARDALAHLRAKELAEERLSSSVALARESLHLHAKKLDEARLTAGAQRELIRLSVIEQPYQLPDPRLPSGLNVVLLSSVAGLMISFGVAVGSDFSKNALRDREDVEHHLAVPLLAAIPDHTRADDR
jgi:uncharacterized protein involved in exopolysaccharide biosynthesis